MLIFKKVVSLFLVNRTKLLKLSAIHLDLKDKNEWQRKALN